jgi:hypothetical protein
MTTESEKYEKVLNLLKKSKPDLTGSDTVNEKIMRKLQEEKSKVGLPELIIEFLFGWVYVGWVRRSMIAATLVIIVLFGYQQALILRRINDLSGQRIQNGTLLMTGLKDDLASKILIYRITGKKLTDGKLSVSEKEIDEMIWSLNKLQVKYRDILNLIEDDPQLKKYVEDRMKENKKY